MKPIRIFVGLFGLYVIGVLFGLIAGVVPNVAHVLSYALRVALTFGLVCVGSLFLASQLSKHAVGKPLQSLIDSMHDDAGEDQENLSAFAVLAGSFVAFGMIFAFANGATIQLYLYNALSKGSLGMIVGLLGTMWFARFVIGVESVGRFSELFESPRNNQAVLFIAVLFDVAVLTAMLVS